MSDYIKRKDVVDWISKVETLMPKCVLEEIINKIPSADVRENVKGEWIDAQYPFSKCSICNCYFDTANNEANFCPNCGAQMVDKDD